MTRTMTLHKTAAPLVAAAALFALGLSALYLSAQTPSSPAPHKDTDNDATLSSSAAPGQWNTDQILTATVHQAWVLSGENEDNFFQIVRQLAAISAQNRGLVLPDSPAAGKKAGEYIRTHAKADHDALLYDIVDKAVEMTGKRQASASASASASTRAQPGH